MNAGFSDKTALIQRCFIFYTTISQWIPSPGSIVYERKINIQRVCSMSQQDYENGLKVRTEVMGESFVKRAQENTVPFTQPLQDWINEHAWGSTWQREGVLPRKYRSLITLAFLTAQKSPTELKGHVRGALNNGATVEEIQEVLLHSLPYCGAPATQEAFRAALEVINDYQKPE
jgi:4-carboxymuconolactone decarboxylase